MKSNLSDEEWRQRLTEDQYRVLRQKGNEPPYTGALLYNEQEGDYTCAGCGNVLFQSDTKFDSGSGWPSFYDVARTDAIHLVQDTSHGMHRVEVRCADCDGHLGHVFNDAPDQPTGLRFCVASTALDFKKKAT